ncbi:UTRA domain-containing protein [Vibrio sp. TH_r3]|uniref:UTRA domain-containing protein n=1 Tax=Vibrio sp. TH_r3 TaxID=3082084 RepID=UPI002953CD59|nr:UTRA domain-containing protein [Vibrio sp. TH_r3]MDV7103390.1 UTRA domain-containing protein [Vibrio sp. TH_r3]
MQYLKIKQTIVDQIDSGLLLAGQKLPTERKFAELFSTTRVTLREALSLLEAEGKIYREDRRGWFVSPQPLRYDLGKMASFTEMTIEQNRTPNIQLISAKKELASHQASLLLQLKPFSDCYSIEQLHLVENRPVAFVINYIKSELFSNLLSCDLTTSLADILVHDYAVIQHQSQFRVSSTSLFGNIAQALRATPGTSATQIERINYNKDQQIINCAIEYWRHDAICIESQVMRNDSKNYN